VGRGGKGGGVMDKVIQRVDRGEGVGKNENE